MCLRGFAAADCRHSSPARRAPQHLSTSAHPPHGAVLCAAKPQQRHRLSHLRHQKISVATTDRFPIPYANQAPGYFLFLFFMRSVLEKCPILKAHASRLHELGELY
jgi:hypothetical protein